MFKLLNSKLKNQKLDAKIGGIGIQNVVKRLELLYPNRHELILEDQGEIFFVRLTIMLDAYTPSVREQGAILENQPYINGKSEIKNAEK